MSGWQRWLCRLGWHDWSRPLVGAEPLVYRVCLCCHKRDPWL